MKKPTKAQLKAKLMAATEKALKAPEPTELAGTETEVSKADLANLLTSGSIVGMNALANEQALADMNALANAASVSVCATKLKTETVKFHELPLLAVFESDFDTKEYDGVFTCLKVGNSTAIVNILLTHDNHIMNEDNSEFEKVRIKRNTKVTRISPKA